mgnify:CR=1 FL=1
MDKTEVRLRIIEAVVPQATKVGITEPEYIVKTCSTLEEYVLGSVNNGELPDSPPVRRGRKPKGRTSETADSP